MNADSVATAFFAILLLYFIFQSTAAIIAVIVIVVVLQTLFKTRGVASGASEKT